MSQDASGGANLVIEKCAMTDAGVYSAKGVNDVGDCETSCVVKVTQPMEEPKFTSLLRSTKAVEGSPIKLDGKMTGHPMPQVSPISFFTSSALALRLGQVKFPNDFKTLTINL